MFKERALANGVEAERIVVEDQAGNLGENVAFVRRLAPDISRATFVTKPNSVLRVSLTVPVQWPEITAFVDAPPLAFPDEVSNVIGLFGVIHEMVGDIDRVIQYPAEGFQVPYPVPSEIVQACTFLVSEGFDQHLLTNSSFRLAPAERVRDGGGIESSERIDITGDIDRGEGTGNGIHR